MDISLVHDRRSCDPYYQPTLTIQALEGLAVDAPLLGVPFSTKEGIRVKGMPHTYGSVSRSGVRASSDADAVALLRKAGAIPICVTNVSEQVRALRSHLLSSI